MKTRTGFLVKHRDDLIPAYDEDKLLIHSLEEGEVVPFKVGDERSLWRLRKYWLLLKKVHQHLPEYLEEKYPTPERLHTEIKLQNGHYDIHITLGGKEIYVVSNKIGSVAFDKMGEARFKDFVEKEAKPTILKHFLSGVNEETFDKEFLSLIFK